MSKAKHETIADIVAALRAVAYIQTAESPRNVLEFANRIEAAAKREREAALAVPPRNCDILSKTEVLEMLKDRSFSKEDTIEWLYDEAKGETK